MNEYELMQGIYSLLGLITFILFFTGFAFIIQFIANIVIISQLPKIKRYERLLYLKAYGFEDDDDEEETEENDDKKPRYNYKFVKNEEQKIKENIEDEEEFNRLVESLGKENIEKTIMWILIGIICIIILLKFIL